MQLFAERARAAKADFALTESNVAAVVVLCRRLDGIPLAIELAAARVRSMSPEDLVSRLDQRFKLLTRGSRAALERHQTLRSTIDWSYDLLDPIDRHALERVSVFSGGCDLAAAESVLVGDDLDAFDVPDVLGQLVDKSLVVADESGDSVRYRLLESIRQYAQEQLQDHGGTATARRAHADHYVTVADSAGQGLRSRDHVVWTETVMRDIDNFRAALDWAVEASSAEHALRLVAQLAVQGSVGEIVMDWADTAIAIPGAADERGFPVVAAWAAWSAAFRADFDRAEVLVQAAERAQARLGVPEVAVVRARATLEFFRGDLTAARRYGEERVHLARAADDTYELANALAMLGGSLQLADLVDEAIVVVDEAVLAARRGGIDHALVFALTLLAGLLPPSDEERALGLLDEAVELGDRIGERVGAATALGAKGAIVLQHREWRAALPHFAGAAVRLLQLGDLRGMSQQFLGAAIALGALDRFEGAALLIGWADAMSARLQRGWAVALLASTELRLIDALGERHVTSLLAQGAALDLEEAVRFLQSEADEAVGTA